jgi:hypothetical protein
LPLKSVAKVANGRVDFDIPPLTATAEMVITGASFSTRDGPNGFRPQLELDLNLSVSKLRISDTIHINGLYIEMD